MKEYKIVHFSDEFTFEDINEAMSLQDDILYFTRLVPEKNELHIVNHKNGSFTLTPFITQVFNFYKQNEKLSHLVKEAKVKGNDNFAIVLNTNDELINQLKKDLNILLKK